jgi:hypothetical protein
LNKPSEIPDLCPVIGQAKIADCRRRGQSRDSRAQRSTWVSTGAVIDGMGIMMHPLPAAVPDVPPVGCTDARCERSNARSPGDRQCSKTGTNTVDTLTSIGHGMGADLDVLDTVEHLFISSGPFTHQRSAVRYRPRPPMFMQVSAIGRYNRA